MELKKYEDALKWCDSGLAVSFNISLSRFVHEVMKDHLVFNKKKNVAPLRVAHWQAFRFIIQALVECCK